jgi:acetyl esterase/lipase
MKINLSFFVFSLHALVSLALLVKYPPQKGQSLIDKGHDAGNVKLIPRRARKQLLMNKRQARMQMLARELPSSKSPETDCIACFGVQVVYGKYSTEDGDQIDNSYYLFKDPAHKTFDDALPIIIHFHAGGFFSGAPWSTENDEIKAYVSKGFAVVSVGYRLATDKYVYQTKLGENKSEELIHVAKDGKLSLDTSGKTMDDYKVRVGKQEFITKALYDATQMIEHLIENGDKFGLDVNRIVFAGESSGGALMQYLAWVYHKWNQGRYTPKGMVYHNAQLNFPVHNMLGETWALFADAMGPETKLEDVVSQEACPTIIGNHMCGSPLGDVSDYNLCNKQWNEISMRKFCGPALKSATLGEVQTHQVWPKEDTEVGHGMEKLWYASENMQQHMPSDPFYIYVANKMNGTSSMDVAHHSVFALNFAKFAEMGKHGGHQYTVYYTDFHNMTDADRGMQRLEVSEAPGDLGAAMPLSLPEAAASPAAAAPAAMHTSLEAGLATHPPSVAALKLHAGLVAPPGPAPAPMPAPAPAPAPEEAGVTVFNYLSTHDWREDPIARNLEAGSMEERVLYACLAAKVGPFKEIPVKENKTDNETDIKESGALQSTLPSLGLAVMILLSMLSNNL